MASCGTLKGMVQILKFKNIENFMCRCVLILEVTNGMYILYVYKIGGYIATVLYYIAM